MRIPLLFFTLATLPPLAVAEEDSFQLGIVEVSGGANQTLDVDKEVISAEDISRYNRNDVASALNLLPGVSIQNLGQRNERLIFFAASPAGAVVRRHTGLRALRRQCRLESIHDLRHRANRRQQG